MIILPFDAFIQVFLNNKTTVLFFKVLAVTYEIFLLFCDEILNFRTIWLSDHVETMINHLIFRRRIKKLIFNGLELFLVEHDQT